MQTNTKFLVDVDDVLMALVPSMIKLYNREFNENMVKDDVKIYYTEKSFPKVAERYGNAPEWFFQTHGHELFTGADMIDGAAEAIEMLMRFGSVEIVTKQRSTQNKIDTLRWLDKHNIKYDSVSFVKDKSIVCCEYFIDDFHENFVNCGVEGAVGILIDAPYNRDIDLNELVKRTGFDRIERWKSIYDFALDYTTNLPF